MFVTWQVLAYHGVDETLHLAQFLVGHLLEVREVETERVGADERTLLLHMVAQHLFQGIVEKVCGSMVGSAAVALVNIYASHEVGRGVFRQLLDDVYALVVLALGVDDLDGLVFVYEHTAVAHLSTHLAIERSVVENEFVEGLLLLCHLSVSEDVALVFGIVISLELLFAFLQHLPVSIFHCSGIACTSLLLLHLHAEASLVNGISVFAADEFSEVERESVGVEEAEGLFAVELSLAVSLQLVHGTVEQVDALVESAQERVFLFLHHASDEFSLSH